MPTWGWLLLGLFVGLNAVIIGGVGIWGLKCARAERRWRDDCARMQEWNG